ncbi:MAG TPA: zinc ribbon domain-containing protein [Dongiaceae bacterium]|nr:zinc ribbon domain-containing protein [Dongiaceae bacterium]
MPLYEYQCRKCGHRFEEIQQYSDPPIKRCPKCKKGKVEKLLSAPAVQFKGTGWYVTDYGRKGSSGGSDSGSKGDKGDKGGKDSGKSDSKSESKSESSSSDKKSSSKD